MAGELQCMLSELDLEQYLPIILHNGYQNWESLSTITEKELAAINVRLGHRRKLQRAIARAQQWPDERPLPTAQELQQHTRYLCRNAHEQVKREVLEESHYSLASPVPSPTFWGNTLSTDANSHGIRDNPRQLARLKDVLQTSSRRFPIPIHGKRYNHLEQGKGKISQALRGLDSVGVQIQIPAAAAADELQRAEVDGGVDAGVDAGVKPFQKWHRTSDVIAHCPGPGVSKLCCCHPYVPADALETCFEAFLQSTNHYLFFFSEFELRRSFCPREHASDDDLPATIYLILALGAKACALHGEEVQNWWYSRARLRLLSEGCLEDLLMMRILVLICVFEIDDDIDVSSRFLDAASSIGLANGLDAQDPTLIVIEEPARSEWLRVWETIRFLYL